LDEYLKIDPNARVACETLLSGCLAVVAGEVRANGELTISIQEIIRNVYESAGYSNESLGFNLNDLEVIDRIHAQSPQIAMAVDRSDGEIGAGDQGIMFGYATNESTEMMPMPVSIAHRLIQKLREMRHNKTLSWLRPDAKCQVTMQYSDGIPVDVKTIILSTQHSPDISLSDLRSIIREAIIEPVLSDVGLNGTPNLLINPAGPFTQGGPGSDTGLTGRKIVIDGYGPFCPVGGGAFSGKDATKVDRSGAYMARFVAKNLVAAGFADRCTVQLAYAIGYPEPMAIRIETNRGKSDSLNVSNFLNANFDLSVTGILKILDLRKPVFRDTARYCHFGLGAEHQAWELIQEISE